MMMINHLAHGTLHKTSIVRSIFFKGGGGGVNIFKSGRKFRNDSASRLISGGGGGVVRGQNFCSVFFFSLKEYSRLFHKTGAAYKYTDERSHQYID